MGKRKTFPPPDIAELSDISNRLATARTTAEILDLLEEEARTRIRIYFGITLPALDLDKPNEVLSGIGPISELSRAMELRIKDAQWTDNEIFHKAAGKAYATQLVLQLLSVAHSKAALHAGKLERTAYWAVKAALSRQEYVPRLSEMIRRMLVAQDGAKGGRSRGEKRREERTLWYAEYTLEEARHPNWTKERIYQVVASKVKEKPGTVGRAIREMRREKVAGSPK